ncbi:MAG: SDR family NAD(P)-dependent oxidoreductase, partial [Vicinamibacteraceae bacterium]
ALARMRPAARGHIVNIVSTAAKRAWANASAYHASKWGLLGFTHALHVEARPLGIKVTAMVCGGMCTPFLLDRFPDIDRTTLQAPENVAEAPLLVSNNTGPVHLAAALGTPVVDLYALTNPQHTPWRVSSRVLFQDVPCRYCYKSVCPKGHHRCLRGVSPGDVLAAIRSLMTEARSDAGMRSA